MGIRINKHTHTHKKKKRKKYSLLHWVNDGIVPALTNVSACACRERDRSPNLWLYLFGHLPCAWYFTWYAIEMQYLHLKTKTQLLTGAFVCKHQVVVWNSVLFEHFEARYVHWQGWIEMGHIFCSICGSVKFLSLCIWKTWAHIPWKATG